MYFNDHSYFDNRFELIPSSQCGSAWRKIRFLYAFLKASKLLQNLLCGRHPGAKLRCFEVQCVPTVCSECDSVFPYGNKLLSGRPLHIPVPTPCTFFLGYSKISFVRIESQSRTNYLSVGAMLFVIMNRNLINQLCDRPSGKYLH